MYLVKGRAVIPTLYSPGLAVRRGSRARAIPSFELGSGLSPACGLPHGKVHGLCVDGVIVGEYIGTESVLL